MRRVDLSKKSQVSDILDIVLTWHPPVKLHGIKLTVSSRVRLTFFDREFWYCPIIVPIYYKSPDGWFGFCQCFFSRPWYWSKIMVKQQTWCSYCEIFCGEASIQSEWTQGQLLQLQYRWSLNSMYCSWFGRKGVEQLTKQDKNYYDCLTHLEKFRGSSDYGNHPSWYLLT